MGTENSGQSATEVLEKFTPEDRMETQLREIRNEALATTSRWQKLSRWERLVEAWYGVAPPEAHGWYLATTAARIGLCLHQKYAEALAEVATLKEEAVNKQTEVYLGRTVRKEQGRRIAELTTQLNERDSQHLLEAGRLQTSIDELASRNMVLTTELADKRMEIEQLEQVNAKLLSGNRALAAGNENLRKLNGTLQERESSISDANVHLHNKLVDIGREVERIRNRPIPPRLSPGTNGKPSA